MIDAILKQAGRDGASQTVRRKKHRVFMHVDYLIRMNSGELCELTMVVATQSRWRDLRELKRWEEADFFVLNCGPFLVATRLSE